ncbi:MAG: alpha-E domain-containing protein [Pseudomonadota bacterium]
MLGKTAGGLFWLARYLERSENTARLVEAGFHMALTRASIGADEWSSILTTTDCMEAYTKRYGEINPDHVIDFLIRDRNNPLSIISSVSAARDNARLTRTALTREMFEAVNDAWLTLKRLFEKPITPSNLTQVLFSIRQQSAQVRGTLHGTMLRTDSYWFSRLGSMIERADNTARILNVKYYLLLPSGTSIGSSLDNVQWEMLLRSTSAERSYNWLFTGEANAKTIANFLLLDGRLPRSLRYCYDNIADNLLSLREAYDDEVLACQQAEDYRRYLRNQCIDQLLNRGLHEFLGEFLNNNSSLSDQIQSDYRFYD